MKYQKMNVINGTGKNKPKLILICRICGEASDSYVNIFGHEGTAHSLSKKISTHLQIEVFNYDLMPKIACNKCFHKLEEFHYFFLASKKVQLLLKNAINESLFSIVINMEPLKNKASSENPSKIKNGNENRVSVSCDKHEDRSQMSKLETICNSDGDQEENKRIINNSPDDKEMLAVDTTDDNNFYYQEILVSVDEKINNAGGNIVESTNEMHEKLSKKNSFAHKSMTDNSSHCSKSNTNQLLNEELDNGKKLNPLLESGTEDDSSELKSVLKEDIDLMDGSIQLSCLSCTEKFREPRELIDHFNERHCNETPVFKCRICGSLYKDLKKFYTHYHNHESAEYACKICGKVFRQKWTLHLHAAVHTDAKRYNCGQCDKSFQTINAIRDHKKKHLPDKPLYTCDYCGRSFRSKFILTSHKRIHTSEEYFICNLCSKSFVSKRLLVYHMSIHNYKENIKCHLCNKLVHTEKLSEHLSTHTSNKKLFKCEYCEKWYRFPSLLKQHIRLHTGELPYKCEDCPKRFRLRNALITHQRQHTGAKPFECKTCDRAFTDFANYIKHMKRIHYNTFDLKKIMN